MRRFFPYKRIEQVPINKIKESLSKLFSRLGQPQWIKVDNGYPFASNKREIIPVLSLWLISLDIDMIWNRPATPEDNAKVERAQGIMEKWVEAHKCQNLEQLTKRVDQAITCHNTYYPVSRLKGKTRIEVFPKIEKHSGRIFNPKDVQIQRVLDKLAQQSWSRSVSKKGQVEIYRHRFSVGVKYAAQKVSIKIDPDKNQWLVFDKHSQLIKTRHTRITSDNIKKLDLTRGD